MSLHVAYVRVSLSLPADSTSRVSPHPALQRGGTRTISRCSGGRTLPSHSQVPPLPVLRATSRWSTLCRSSRGLLRKGDVCLHYAGTARESYLGMDHQTAYLLHKFKSFAT